MSYARRSRRSGCGSGCDSSERPADRDSFQGRVASKSPSSRRFFASMGSGTPDTCTLAEAACGLKKRMTQRASCVGLDRLRAQQGKRIGVSSGEKCVDLCFDLVIPRWLRRNGTFGVLFRHDSGLPGHHSLHCRLRLDAKRRPFGSGGYRGISHRTPWQCATPGALRQSIARHCEAGRAVWAGG